MMEWTAFENQARAEGYTCICGIDEAGRGPLAGPVYAAAVVLRPGQVIEGVNDSKKLSEKKREALFQHHLQPVRRLWDRLCHRKRN